MAKIGEVEVASRYEGIPTGPRLDYSFENQPGQPIDGSNALLRNLAPFTLRLVVPDALLAKAGETLGDLASSVDLISAAARGADLSGQDLDIKAALTAVSPVDHSSQQLETYVTLGQVLAGTSEVYSTIADTVAVADIALQLQRILEAPALTLLVNPAEMTISFSSIQSYESRTRYGFVFERWGEEQPTVSFRGSTGAFIAGNRSAPGRDTWVDAAGRENTVVSGVQFASKRDSAAWQNLTSLFHFFRNNGYIFDTAGRSEAHHFVGCIAIDYDQWTYVGHINSFEYSYDDSKPHNVEWSMEFQVDRMYDNATTTTAVLPLSAPTVSPSDPTYANMGTGGTVPAADLFGSLAGPGEPPEFGTVPFELLDAGQTTQVGEPSGGSLSHVKSIRRPGV